MADWTNIPDVDVEAGGIPKGSTITALRDNVTAVTEGAAGAPKIVNNAIANGTISEEKLVRRPLSANSFVSRSINTTYTNTLARPILVYGAASYTSANTREIQLEVNYGSGLTVVALATASSSGSRSVFGSIPPGAQWRLTATTTNLDAGSDFVGEFR